MRVRVLLILALAATGSLALGDAPVAADDPGPGDPEHAWFEGDQLDLSESWGEANACVVFDDHTECFRSEAEMLDAHPELGETTGSASRSDLGNQTDAGSQSEFGIQAVCSTNLRLYSGATFGGSVLMLAHSGRVHQSVGERIRQCDEQLQGWRLRQHVQSRGVRERIDLSRSNRCRRVIGVDARGLGQRRIKRVDQLTITPPGRQIQHRPGGCKFDARADISVIMAGVVPADDAERRSRYEQLFRSHYRAVENYVMSRHPTLDCPTILSNTFEVAWRRLDSVPEHAVRGWLIGVARNCARNEGRDGLRRQRRVDALVNLERRNLDAETQITAETLAALRSAFERLKANDREILLLADWDGLTGADLGAAVGTSGPTATVRLHRARTRLRHLLLEMGVTS